MMYQITTLTAVLLSHLSAISLAGPLPVTTTTTTTNVRAEGEGCSKEINAPIGASVIDAAQGLGAIMAYTVGGGTIAYNACDAIALAHNQQPGRKCRIFTQSVASGILIGLTFMTNSKSSDGTSTSERRQDKGEGEGEDAAAGLSEMLRSLGVVHEGVYLLPLPPSAVVENVGMNTDQVVNSTGPTIVSRLYVAGVAAYNDNNNNDNNTAAAIMEHTITNYDDGSGFVQATPRTASSNKKRHDGPGFKFNFRRFDTNTNFLGQPDLSGLPDYANAVSLDWGGRVDDDGVDEYIFTGGIDHLYTFGMRIIPEIQGFGEDYEDVDICGDLAPIAHDELKV